VQRKQVRVKNADLRRLAQL